ncbi:potassium channel family protein [Phenylobacterium sp.]|uniref:potassium channel family protein n=1 Tax=Phenylobacterium sp. TaxID=1871053 RepID=UPI00286C4FAB|nr:potassium channel family protein [Phenylobacterium sp.]
MSLFWQLFAATLLVGFTALLHLAGLAGLIALIQAHGKRVRTPHVRLNQALLVLVAVFALIALHGVEIWLYATVYALVGEFPAFEDALYFSTSTYATIGYGDLVLSPAWRIVGAIEGVNGIILLGWSTAFFVSIVGRLAELERDDPP